MSSSRELGLSISQTSLRELIQYFGVDDRKLEAAERLFGEIAERAELFLIALAPFLEPFAASMNSLAEEPEAPGYERFFIEWLGYHPLVARLMTRQMHRLGHLLANEINEGRRVRAIVDEIAKAKNSSALVISRRAGKLRRMQLGGGANRNRSRHPEGPILFGID